MLYTSNPEGIRTGKLLSEPQEEPMSFNRDTADYENHTDRFKLKERNFQRQYAHVYASRLLVMWPKLKEAAKHKWGEF